MNEAPSFSGTRFRHLPYRAPSSLKAGLLLALILLAGCTTPSRSQSEASRTLRIATTTSVDNTGLMALLTEPFQKRYGVTIQVLAVGSGQALKLARNGDVDLVLTHDPEAEAEFLAEGFGVDRFEIMYNDFVVVGPADDPAKVKGAGSAPEAMRRIAGTGSPFVSRGDRSGTHLKELALWKEAGISPEGTWYAEAGQGQRMTLEMADQKMAYALVDRATLETSRKQIKLTALFEDPKTLHNPYSAIPVSAWKHKESNVSDAMAFVGFLLSSQGQEIISSFQVDGKTLFVPQTPPQGTHR